MYPGTYCSSYSSTNASTAFAQLQFGQRKKAKANPGVYPHQKVFSALVKTGLLPKPKDIVIDRETVELEQLPSPLDGVKIAHVSDLHASDRTFGIVDEDYYKRGFRKLAEENPDVITFTGDAIHLTHKDIDQAQRLFTHLPNTTQRFAVLGNHDGVVENFWKHISPDMASEKAGRVNDMLQQEGFTVLRNSQATPELKGTPVSFYGIDDVSASNGMPDKNKVKAALSALQQKLTPGKEAGVSLALVHDPAVVDEWLNNGLPGDLFLAGHTHNGHHTFKKGSLPDKLMRYLKKTIAFGEPKYNGGLYALKGDKQLHVSPGLALPTQPLRDHVAFTIPPLRIGQAPSISVLTLKPSSSRDNES